MFKILVLTLLSAGLQAVTPVNYFSCGGDTHPGSPTQGIRSIPLATDVVALCDGWVVVALKDSNAVRVLHAPSGAVDRTFNLTASPSRLTHDPDRGLVYATLSGANSLARLNLNSGAVDYIPMHWYGKDLAMANCGYVVVATQASSPWWDAEFEVIDGPSGLVLNRSPAGDGFTIDYDRMNQRLVSGVVGSSPSSIFSWAHDPVTHAFTQSSTLWNPGSNGQDIAVSPDGAKTAFACGGGNAGTTYGIADFSTGNWGTTYGTWSVGPYPRAVAFSPGGSFLAASNGHDLLVFNTFNHMIELAFLDVVDSYDLYRVAYSRGGKFVYGLETPWSGATSDLFWAYTSLVDASPPLIPNYCGSPTPSPTFSVSPTESPTLTVSSTFSASPTPTPTATITQSRTVSQTRTASPTPTPTPTATQSQTASRTRTASQTQTASPSGTRTPTATATQSPTPSATPTRTSSLTVVPTASATLTISGTPSPAPSPSASQTRTPPASALPESDAVLPPYPNPFRPSTGRLTVPFELKQAGPVWIRIYDLRGAELAVLVNGVSLPAGTHAAHWDGLGDRGQRAASGIYLLHFKTGLVRQVKRVVLVR